eukprot:TRINITY_DN3392_c0_g2_i1.p1 TRINITY_DN3392_c0_g2~~TRINITY_DN3392_c0_g2_i1.p1  ORF type:complete len:476 (-),score=104.14 TRINITY_DN3392_c0_g2_i1:334-1761(-)
MDEALHFQKLTHEIEEWWKSPRWEGIYRPYRASDVARLRNSIPLSYPAEILSKKLHKLLSDNFERRVFSHTFGVLDPVQITNLAKYLKTVYVSGWQCSSTASVTNEPGPDFADYPANTVPAKVDQLFKALLFHDRKQNEARSRMTDEERRKVPKVDYMVPMIADGDTGFGGVTSVMKMIKLFIEAGAAGVHLEDQRAGTKKCGHMGGKVLVPTREHVERLIASRLQADIMGVELVLVARTDALSAKYLDSNIDPIDHPFIFGVWNSQKPKDLLTFPEAGSQIILNTFKDTQQQEVLKKWEAKAKTLSLTEAFKFAKELGFVLEFDWEACRSIEGFYPVKGSIDFCVARAKEYAKYSDMIWMETPTPDLEVARQFASSLHAAVPKKFLCYNLSPSFNWDAAKMTDKQIADFVIGLANVGYCWQFITLAGFHMNALISEKFARDFSQRLMISYVESIQRKEAKNSVDQLRHQKFFRK